MPYPALAQRSGVSEPTVKRVLAGRIAEASFGNVVAIAEALGMPLMADPIDAEDLLEQVAREKAVRVAQLVQGTSALEAQAVDSDQYRKLVEQSMHELLTGSRRLLWSS